MIVTRYVLRKSCFVYSTLLSLNVEHQVHRLCVKTFTQLCANKPFVVSYIYPPSLHLNLKRNSSTAKQKLLKAVQDYGITVIVFHVTISLISLAGFYLAVYSGLDLVSVFKSFGFKLNEQSTAVAGTAGTFVVAYAVHKVFAPVRISITLATVPFVVRYLRNKGILKPSKRT